MQDSSSLAHNTSDVNVILSGAQFHFWYSHYTGHTYSRPHLSAITHVRHFTWNTHTHTNTHTYSRTWRYHGVCGLQEHTDTCQSLIFSSPFENRGGLQAKLKTHGTFHLKGQPWRRGGLGSERVGVFLNTWSVSGNSRVIATTGQQGRAYMVVCVLAYGKKYKF